MRLILTFTFGFLALMLLQAQQQFDNYKAPLKIAQKAQKSGSYTTAAEHYAIVMSLIEEDNPKKAVYHKEYGVSLLHTQQLSRAIDEFDQALDLGKNTFKNDEKQEIKDYKKIAMSTLINTSMQSYLMANPVDIEITNMGKEINSEYDDCCISYSPDDLLYVFTSRRKPLKGGKNKDGQYSEDLFYAKRKTKNDAWGEVENLGNGINTKAAEHTSLIMQDGKMAYHDRYVSEKEASKAGYGGNVDIFLSKIISRNNWIDSIRLPKSINTPYWDAHPYVTPDGNTLYFASDRPGGKRGRDIYYSEKNESGEWSEAINLGDSINTEFDEVSPFLSDDGNTLFFSSNGLPGIGSFDVFRSIKLPNGNWSKPINMGYPINSDVKDVFFRLQGAAEKIYLASSRKGGLGALDLYSDGGSADKLALGINRSTGSNTASETDDDSTNTDSGAKDPDSSFAEDGVSDELDSTEEASSSLPSDSSNLSTNENETVEEGNADTEDIPTDNALAPSSTWEEVQDISILFDFNDATLKSSEIDKLDRMVEFLLEHPSAVVEVSGHTDHVGSDAYNVDLSVSRVKTAVDYMIREGINAKQFYSKCVGEKQPNQDNSTEKGRQKNRRVEFKILGDADVYNYDNQPSYKGVYIDAELLAVVNAAARQPKGASSSLLSGISNKSIDGLVFKVQVGAFRNNVDMGYFEGIPELQNNESDDGITRYTSGVFSTIDEAKGRKELVQQDIDEAFITAYQDGKRISLAEAIKLLK